MGTTERHDRGVARTVERQPGFCEASTYLTPVLRAELIASYPDVQPDLVADDLVCHLAVHDDGDHFAIVYDHLTTAGAAALWTRWRDEFPRAVLLRPDCPSRSPGQSIACGHFEAHLGAHSWELEKRR